MNNMCITGYFVEDTKLTEEEEKKDFIESLNSFHIEDYGDGTGDEVRTGTQEEYDALTEHNPGTLYIIRDV